jgi:hypothetical protein
MLACNAPLPLNTPKQNQAWRVRFISLGSVSMDVVDIYPTTHFWEMG